MWTKGKTYYVGYDVYLQKDKVIHGSGTFACRRKPDLKKWIDDIEKYNSKSGVIPESIQILSCIECKSNFIEDGIDDRS